jgi:hypothetical protein
MQNCLGDFKWQIKQNGKVSSKTWERKVWKWKLVVNNLNKILWSENGERQKSKKRSSASLGSFRNNYYKTLTWCIWFFLRQNYQESC